jgi:serine protease SohB
MRIPLLDRSPAVAVVRLTGMIAAGPRGLSDASLAPVLDRAFRRGRPKAVALVINSPGGSAVQSSLIAARIRRLAEEREVPVLAFVEDLAASGGYWLASAADEIWVDAGSIVGSIGVIYAGFGFHGLLERHGVERRVHTAGRSKSFLDPFSPEKETDVTRLAGLQKTIHEAFIAQVKARRGTRLAEGEELFGGEVWTGARAVELGLADGVGHMVPELKRRYGDRVRLLEYGRRRPLLQRLGASLTDEVAGALEERALWARFGF